MCARVCVCVCARVCNKYGVQAIYITMQLCVQVCTFMHMYAFVKTNKNPTWYKLRLCVHACVCVCVCVTNMVHRQVCKSTLCKNSVRNKNPKSLQVVQAQSVCLCVYAQVCTYIHAHVRFVKTV